MIRNKLFLLLAALAFAFTAASGAQAEDVKIGVVDTERAMFGTEAGKAARDELERKSREAQAEIKPLVDRRDALAEELQSKKFVLSEDALFQKQAELAELQNKIESKAKELEGQLKIDQGRLFNPLQQKLIETIEAIGKEQGFTLILQRGGAGIVYSREALDITDLVVSRSNAG